ncbi:dienelactone hydrolase family protein [Novosphingobium sp. JCM 18896]|uniref:dienelactone hydrolase family protein n=1 Tax=Novosphingobium sp. JCM 18896 TaxID=2989731 RepID=UPI002222D534|nr:dienelactone hydrolase family protein [Novosphingobium sp. JCM 18896]MCW1428406.1 dienelactone hydrolase family protein [Novosphingobium sp. JCM 18896]
MTSLERVDYAHGQTALTGWLARPVAAPRAAIVLYPTIANVTPAAERRARMLAELGYLVLIADFYGVAEGDWPALAKDLRADTDRYRARLAAAVATLSAYPAAAGLALGAVGYCMGGQAALEMARDGQDLRVAATFHGLLETGRPAEPGAIRPRLLVCHGDADPMVPRAQVMAFWEEMDRADANWHFHAYSGVKHGFTDPGSDARGIPAIAYDASADRQSWAAMTALFDEVFAD